MNDILFVLIVFELLSQANKLIIASPFNKDHRATYYQGEVSIPYIEAIFKGSSPFYLKPLKTTKNLFGEMNIVHLKRDLQLVI